MRKIKDINKDIKTLKSERLSYIFKRKKLRSKMFAQLALVGVIATIPGVVVGGLGKVTGRVPFHRDDKVVIERMKEEITSDGEYDITSQYGFFPEEKEVFLVDECLITEPDQFILYGSWKKTGDKYQRTVLNYDIKGKNCDVQELMKLNDEELTKKLGRPIINKELKDNITLEEYNRGAYYKATIFSKNDNNTITVKQSNKEVLEDTVMGVLLYSAFLPATVFALGESEYMNKLLNKIDLTKDEEFAKYTEKLKELRKEKSNTRYLLKEEKYRNKRRKKMALKKEN